jgi:hypothetical protein
MMVQLLDFLGLPGLVVPDLVAFVVLSCLFLFCVAETFRLLELVIDRLTRRNVRRGG